MTQYRVWNGSAVAYLCSQSCSNVFVLSNRRIVSCRYCKVGTECLRYTRDTKGHGARRTVQMAAVASVGPLQGP